ncbi:hypothetical protein BH20PSE1_BH20PSE1_27320 [soil metagenome]
MFRKSFFTILFITGLVVMGQTQLLAQYAAITGKVELQQDDNTRVPVAGALIEVFRTDIKTRAPSAKTNKKGEFSFAGAQFGATYTFSVSAPNCAPNFYSGIKAGQENISIILTPGNGNKLTEAEVRQGAAAAKDPEKVVTEELTEEGKRQKAEHEAKVAEITAKNEKVAKSNETIERALKEGNEALAAKNYDLAITKFDEGIEVDATFVGSAPVFYNKRAVSLVARAIDQYNKGVKLTDPKEKIDSKGKTRKDLADASDSYLKAWNVLITASEADIANKTNYEAAKVAALSGATDAFAKAVRTEQVDPVVIEFAKVLMPEYRKMETDAAKKAEASLTFADLYRVAGESESAIAAYKAILETSPDNQDALAGAGFSLINLGYLNENRAALQEGSNMLQKFVGLAPDTHKFKADAVALIDTLKKEQNVAPQKVPAPPRRRN